MSTSLSPAHALLAIGLKTLPVSDALRAADAWTSLNLMQPGRQPDGETDVTVFLKHLPTMVDLLAGKDDRSAWIVTQLELLTQHTSLFEANADGVTGWDLLQARESLVLTRWWLARADRPSVANLMQRVPTDSVPAARGMKVPTVWAAWALQDRGDELSEVKEAEQGLDWPADVLGWAHPQLVKDLLDWGAPWNANVKDLWAARQRQGQLPHKDVAQMQTRCAVTLDRDLSEIQTVVWRNGADVIKLLKTTKDGKNWQQLLAEAGDLSSFTAPYKVITPDGPRTMEVPLFVRLLSMTLSSEFTQEKTHTFLHFMTEGFSSFAPDPHQLAPGTSHTLGTVAHTVAIHLAEVYAQFDRSAASYLDKLHQVITEWAGPMEWDAVVACADDLDSHGPALLFSNVSSRQSFQRGINAHGMSEACQQLAHLSQPSPEKIQVPAYRQNLGWVHWAVERFQQPGKNRGVLTSPTSHKGYLQVVDPDQNKYTPFHGKALFHVMTPEQQLIMVTAFFLGATDENAMDGSSRLKGALWAQTRWERANEATRRLLMPMIKRLAQGEGKGWPEVMERTAALIAADRQVQALDVTPAAERRRPRPRA